MSSGLPIWISDELEAWPEKDGPIRFSQIAGLHSEFIGISLKGELHQWKWSDTEAYRNVEVNFFFFFDFRNTNFNTFCFFNFSRMQPYFIQRLRLFI